MSEDDIHINGVVQVGTFMIIGLIYISILYVLATAGIGSFLDISALNYLTSNTRAGLASHEDSAKIILIGGIVFLGIITGMLAYDLGKKFSIISLFLLLVITAVDFVPIKIIIEGGIK